MTTCVLFGAGVELDFDLCNGGDFAKIVVGLEKSEEYKNAMQEFYKEVDDKDSWFPNYKNSNYKVQQETLFKAAYSKSILNSFNTFDTKKEFCDEIDEKWKSLLDTNKNLRQEEYAYVEKMINDNTSYMQMLDEKFHTMIAPKVLGSKKFWYVISCYWRAYLCLVMNMVDDMNPLEVMCNPKHAYDKMVQFAKNKQSDEKRDGSKQLDKNENNRRETYYSILKEYIDGTFNGEKCKVNVITTNYTPLCEVMCGIDKAQIAYVNGAFKWFERPRQMDVFDVTDGSSVNETENHDYFPFIFLQSGVKPIVHPIQLEEYGKCLDFLKKSDRLIIVGYKVNSDDNHLNSIIRAYLKHGKKVIYMNYKDKDGDDRDRLLKVKLRMDDAMECLKVIDIDEQNCYSRFREVLFKDA